MSALVKVHALFFTERGAGPDNVSLWTEPVPALAASSTDPTIIAPRTLGLRIGQWTTEMPPPGKLPLFFAVAGGFQMDEATVRALHEQFGAWLDAPRLDAREHAEVVAEDDGVRLLKTSAGEWGVGASEEVDGANVEAIAWCDGGEAAARKLYDDMLDRVVCDGCDKRVAADDATDHGDGYYCEDCADEERERFKRTAYRCVDAACGWSGMGPETERDDDGAPECPRCGEYVEERPAPAVPAEATSP